ncbi:MAG: carbohydrate ABC transporter permease [Paenibacillaceae bacterium]|uniref:carbohydrate ABC transporter permease n=1 Tax=Paenibacillus cymbidii TaxID=1639034 RepID=UPI001080510F|nr:carbohydrate ABC transporter permease [Paenibacillus cymbidii]MBO9606171.1 carbohydrate ABC transporter permease [Paenibacillaceae bacterium]
MKNSGFANRLFDAANYLLLILLTLSILVPFVYMFSISVSAPLPIANHQIGLLPKGINWQSYAAVFHDNQIVNAYWNSIRYTALGTFLVLAIGSLTAYPLSLRRFKARTALTLYFTVTMFVSGGLIPAFLNIKSLGMLDTIWAIALPSAFGFWNIIILRTNFQGIPQELYESAFMDGANDWHIFTRIVLPLSKAILATISLFASVGFWNAYFGPLMYLTSPDMQPLTIILRRILIANEVLSSDAVDNANSMFDAAAFLGRTEGIRMATIFVTIGPIVLVYPFIQKYFVKGVLVGSIKG